MLIIMMSLLALMSVGIFMELKSTTSKINFILIVLWAAIGLIERVG